MHEPTPRDAPPLELLNVCLDTPGPELVPQEPAPTSARWRWAIAAFLVAGLLVGFLSLAREPQPLDPRLSPAAVPPVGLSGFAELYVSTYLTASGPERASSIAAFYRAAPAMAAPGDVDRFVTRAVVLDATRTGGATWAVRVAADVLVYDQGGYVSDGRHHYVVGVLAAGDGFAATSLPARIADPPAAPIPAGPTWESVDDPGTLALAVGFLRAYLLGEGDLRAYAPAAELSAATPPPFVDLSVVEIERIPLAPGTDHVRVLATVTPARGSALRTEYHLVVTDEDGTRRVRALVAGPPPASQREGSGDS